MRIGINPEKADNELVLNSYHRIVIPVYIPNLTDPYFKDGLKILKLCIDSMLLTIHDKTKVSIINNACCSDVSDYLDQVYNQNPCIDQLLKSKINLGKVNALYAAIKSNLEPLITVADADVMFLNNWQGAVENVFSAFPEAGMVSPVPSSTAYRGKYVNSSLYYALFKGKLKFKKVQNPKGLIKFQESIGRIMYNDTHLEKYLVLSNKKSEAVLGCGHFLATLRSEVFHYSPSHNCQHKIIGGSENKYIDEPNDKAGFLRLSTLGNYGYHLGNRYEPWMLEEMEELRSSKIIKKGIGELNLMKPSPMGLFAFKIGKVINLYGFRKFRKIYFYFKGVKNKY